MPVITYLPIVILQNNTVAAEYCAHLKMHKQSIAWQTCDSDQLTLHNLATIFKKTIPL